MEGKIIHVLLKMINAKTVLEIGTLGGYSATWIARALPDDGKLVCIEKSEEHYLIAKQNFDSITEGKKINLLKGDAKEILQNFDSSFDAIFIDANKSAYPYYLEQASRLLRKNGLIIADNTFLFGQVYDPAINGDKEKIVGAMREFNKQISDSARFTSVILPTDDGLTIAIKN
ncbi:mycolic acid cyclopropane synthetase family protein [Collimonas pratensis]|uniref:Mycolic acid cyclopropane synthetase family protein n=2 Tax=Collimonas pratensis TaxID=279113 RepID=A0A127Q7B0_9BURK|nr:mycolic acid cyclopropane synthetase family protein [Collimonas pratensis]